MRIRHILKEQDDMQRSIKQACINMFIPLKNEGQYEVAFGGVLDYLFSDTLAGMDVSESYIVSIINSIPEASVVTGADGKKTVSLVNVDNNKSSETKDTSNEVEQSAIKAAKSELK